MTLVTEDFSRRVARGGAWMITLRTAARAMALVQTIVLARLLVPHDFGLIGIAYITLATAEALTQTGLEAALIHRKGVERRYLDTAWSIGAARGGLLLVAGVAAAPWVARFFDAPAAEPLVAVMALSFMMKGLVNIGVVRFRKDLRFDKQFTYELTGLVPTILVSLAVAVVVRNAWALAAGILAGQAVQLLASYRLDPYRPRPRLDRAALRDLYGFGKWIFGTNLLTFAANTGDDLFVGRVLGATPLGLYQMAFRIGEKPREDITSVISQVTLPAYAAIQTDRARLGRAYAIGLESTSAVVFPMVGGLVLLASELTLVLLGAEWLPMAPALRVLAVAGGLRAMLALGGNLSQGVGRPDLDLKMNLLRLVVMAAAMYPFSMRWGLAGTAAAVATGLAAALPVWLFMSTRIAGLGYSRIARALTPAAAGTVIMLAALVSLKSLLARVDLLAFATLVLTGAAVYLAVAYVLWKVWDVGPIQTGLRLRGAMRP